MKELWEKRSNKIIVGVMAALVLLFILFMLVSGGGKSANSHIRLGDK